MATKRQIQEILKMGVSRNTLSKMTLKEIKNLHESMINAQGFVGMDKPIGRMTSVKKSEIKEMITKQVLQPTKNAEDAKKLTDLVTKADPNMSVELGEVKKRKKKVEKNPWAICTSSLDLNGKKRDDYTKGEKKKFERCVLDVKKSLKEGKNPYEVILERKMRDIVEENLRPTMTKKDLIKSILESKTKEKTKEKEKTTTPTRKNPFQPAPNTDPKPKGSGTKEKEKTKEKERTTISKKIG